METVWMVWKRGMSRIMRIISWRQCWLFGEEHHSERSPALWDWTSYGNLLLPTFLWVVRTVSFQDDHITQMNNIKSFKDEGWKSKVMVGLWYYRQSIWDLLEHRSVKKKIINISSSLWSWSCCLHLFILHVTDILVVYFNYVQITVIFLGRIASILLQNCSGIHPLWILSLYIAFWLALGCVLRLLKLTVYIFFLGICLILALGLLSSCCI